MKLYHRIAAVGGGVGEGVIARTGIGHSIVIHAFVWRNVFEKRRMHFWKHRERQFMQNGSGVSAFCTCKRIDTGCVLCLNGEAISLEWLSYANAVKVGDSGVDRNLIGEIDIIDMYPNSTEPIIKVFCHPEHQYMGWGNGNSLAREVKRAVSGVVNIIPRTENIKSIYRHVAF